MFLHLYFAVLININLGLFCLTKMYLTRVLMYCHLSLGHYLRLPHPTAKWRPPWVQRSHSKQPCAARSRGFLCFIMLAHGMSSTATLFTIYLFHHWLVATAFWNSHLFLIILSSWGTRYVSLSLERRQSAWRAAEYSPRVFRHNALAWLLSLLGHVMFLGKWHLVARDVW